MSRDRYILYTTAFLRALATGMMGVLLGIYLARMAFTPSQIGLVISIGLMGATLAALLVTYAGDHLGRRRLLLWLALLSALGGVALASSLLAAALFCGCAEVSEAGTGIAQAAGVITHDQAKSITRSAAAVEKTLKADKSGSLNMKRVVDWLQKWGTDLTLAAQGLPVRYFAGEGATIGRLATPVTASKLFNFNRKLCKYKAQSEHPLNSRLFLEEIFFGYRDLFVSQGGANVRTAR